MMCLDKVHLLFYCLGLLLWPVLLQGDAHTEAVALEVECGVAKKSPVDDTLF